MRRAKLIDRVRLLGEKRTALVLAAIATGTARANVGESEYSRRCAEARLEEAAIEYASVAFRYLGGEKP